MGRTQSLPLTTLKGTLIGFDAAHYIQQHLLNQSTREALLGALGGFPFALKSNIEKELQALKNLGIGCIFVFNGLEFGKRDHRTQAQPASSRPFEQAWELYDQQQADQVVDAFSNAGMTPFFHANQLVWSSAPTPDEESWNWREPSPPTITDAPHLPGTPPPETLFKFLQRILTQNGISFMVAPYSAAAQVSI